ncbi:Uncharacterised protein [Shigella sonnei]|nr:Uncharacterised protein [Shigella sonnei]CSR59757.1 Uncharacterised protein [Shigella sonnei]
MISLSRRADRTRRPDNRGNRQDDQRDNFQRRKEVAHGIQQLARIERNQNNDSEIDQAVDKQRQRGITSQRRNPHFKGNGSCTRRSEKRPHRQVTNRCQQHASDFTDWRAEAVNTAANFCQRHYR